jgi:hypothetical protein
MSVGAERSPRPVRVASDVGGTFTDNLAYDPRLLRDNRGLA